MASRNFPQQLLQTFPDIDPNVRELFLYVEDIKQWHLFIRQEYPYLQKGKACLLGAAARPMMPDQDEGLSQATEDASALGLLLSKEHAKVIS
jgi:salicylate hydroxylase